MTPSRGGTTAALAILLIAGTVPAAAQTAFKIPFRSRLADETPVGRLHGPQDRGRSLTLRQEATGKEVRVPFTERLAQPKPPWSSLSSSSDEVGRFRAVLYGVRHRLHPLGGLVPSRGRLPTHTTKGAHKTRSSRPLGPSSRRWRLLGDDVADRRCGETPLDERRLRVGPRKRRVVDTGVLGVDRTAASLDDGVDHAARRGHGLDIVFGRRGSFQDGHIFDDRRGREIGQAQTERPREEGRR